MPTEIKFNLNNKIKVSLNGHGIDHYQKWFNDCQPEGKKLPRSHFLDQIDDKGYIEFHAWEFMQIFGPTIVFGSSPIFSTDIKLLIP